MTCDPMWTVNGWACKRCCGGPYSNSYHGIAHRACPENQPRPTLEDIMNEAPNQTPTISYRTLNPDDCNVTDPVFLDEARAWFADRMPGFPLNLLDPDHEQWEVHEPEIDGPWEVCETEYVDEDGDTDTGFAVFHPEERDEARDETVDVWILEEEAEDKARELNEDHAPARYGHPWAHGWAHRPDRSISDELLHAAGFIVATYTSPDGDTHRLCGIDGGGYSFEGAHFVKLYALWAVEVGRTVATKDGERMITFEGGA